MLINMHCHFSAPLTLSELKELAVVSEPRGYLHIREEFNLETTLLQVLFYSYHCQRGCLPRRDTAGRLSPSCVCNNEWQTGGVKEGRRNMEERVQGAKSGV